MPSTLVEFKETDKYVSCFWCMLSIINVMKYQSLGGTIIQPTLVKTATAGRFRSLCMKQQTPSFAISGSKYWSNLFSLKDELCLQFHFQSPPFWSNAIANSINVTYDGMIVNATNMNDTFIDRKYALFCFILQHQHECFIMHDSIVHNTDGLDTYRVDNIKLFNWDVRSEFYCIYTSFSQLQNR
jgi:hypothetical protein